MDDAESQGKAERASGAAWGLRAGPLAQGPQLASEQSAESGGQRPACVHLQ